MDGQDVLKIVEAIRLDKNIDEEIVFEGIEQAILSAARKHFGEEQEIQVVIDRKSGEPQVTVNTKELEANDIGDLIGRIGAQTAKQVMIQKIREAERDALYDDYVDLETQIITGTVTRVEHGTATVNIGKVDAILPRGEMIAGESHRVGERVRAVVLEVSKSGSRIKIVLSRRHTDFVRRLFELEIPEIGEHVIEVRSLAREAGYRSKVAVSCYDNKIDCVGACVGVRGSRIKNIIDELGGERIDIVRWNDSLQVLVPNALQPAEVEDVILCPELGKVIVLVRDDQLSLAIGKKGQNVRLASKLVGWDIDVMTQAGLDQRIDNSVAAFAEIPGINEDVVEKLIEEGFFTFDDLSVIEPEFLTELSGLDQDTIDGIIEYADEQSARIEAEEKKNAQEKRQRHQSSPKGSGETAGAVVSLTQAVEAAVEDAPQEPQDEEEPPAELTNGDMETYGEEPATADATASDSGDSSDTDE